MRGRTSDGLSGRTVGYSPRKGGGYKFSMSYASPAIETDGVESGWASRENNATENKVDKEASEQEPWL
jgi:hypothetical protein